MPMSLESLLLKRCEAMHVHVMPVIVSTFLQWWAAELLLLETNIVALAQLSSAAAAHY